MKNNKSGITLIALVITIVVLIILAAVAINLSLGNNGIFNRAKTAKEQYQNAQVDENEKITKYSNKIDSYVGGNRENRATPLKMEVKHYVMGANVYNTDDDAIKLNDLKNYKKLKITCSGNVGDWIKATVYIDEEEKLIILDSLEHILELNSNSNLRINCKAINGLGLGAINIAVEAE